MTNSINPNKRSSSLIPNPSDEGGGKHQFSDFPTKRLLQICRTPALAPLIKASPLKDDYLALALESSQVELAYGLTQLGAIPRSLFLSYTAFSPAQKEGYDTQFTHYLRLAKGHIGLKSHDRSASKWTMELFNWAIENRGVESPALHLRVMRILAIAKRCLGINERLFDPRDRETKALYIQKIASEDFSLLNHQLTLRWSLETKKSGKNSLTKEYRRHLRYLFSQLNEGEFAPECTAFKITDGSDRIQGVLCGQERETPVEDSDNLTYSIEIMMAAPWNVAANPLKKPEREANHVGSALIEGAMEEAMSLEPTDPLLTAWEVAQNAEGFYRRIGLQYTHVVDNLDGDSIKKVNPDGTIDGVDKSQASIKNLFTIRGESFQRFLLSPYSGRALLNICPK